MNTIDYHPRNWRSACSKSWETRGPLGSGAVHYMSGTRRWRASLNLRTAGGVVFFDEAAGTPRAALSKLQRAIDRTAHAPVRLALHKATPLPAPTLPKE